jgi:hypothetical protein
MLWRIALLRALPLIFFTLVAAPAFAQQFPAAPLQSPGEQVRTFWFKNESGQVIMSVQAHMTDGKNRVLTYAPVEPTQAREIVVPREECIDSMAVHLNNGRTLRADHMNDCKATQIVVGEAGIGVQSNVNPGQ